MMYVVWARSNGGTVYHLGIYSTEELALKFIAQHVDRVYPLNEDRSYSIEERRPGWKVVILRSSDKREIANFYITELAVDSEIPDIWEIK